MLVLLGVQRSKTKKSEKQDDVISQASYMTYSTTVSDTSVNYGPNWDKVNIWKGTNWDMRQLSNETNGTRFGHGTMGT